MAKFKFKIFLDIRFLLIKSCFKILKDTKMTRNSFTFINECIEIQDHDYIAVNLK